MTDHDTELAKWVISQWMPQMKITKYALRCELAELENEIFKALSRVRQEATRLENEACAKVVIDFQPKPGIWFQGEIVTAIRNRMKEKP